MIERETIAAIATGLTDSGIGIIRISGRNAVDIGNHIFQSPSGKKNLQRAKDRMLYYGYITDAKKGDIIDEVMVVVMRAPRSFTGEDTVEIQCHGGVFVMQKILENVLKSGARLADPGEFTKRAFLNGRMDLSRAEAVMDLIQSQNETALSSSLDQLRGNLSEKIKKIRDEILYETAFIESALDDPEHISLEGYPERLSEKIEDMAACIEKMISTAGNGRLIKEGINTVIVGKPNAGKSSVLNCIVGEDRAIVTDIAGTTRDVLRETVRLGNICLNIIDTAGIRNTADTVEKIGVEKARKYAGEADLIVYVADASVDLDRDDEDIVSLIKNKKVIVLLNKSDLENKVSEEKIVKMFQNVLDGCSSAEENDIPVVVKTSAKEGSGMEEFEQAVENIFFQGGLKSSGEIIITNLRHKKELEEAFASLTLIKKSIEDGMPEDFYSIDLMNAYTCLGRIIGEEVDGDLVEEIFSRFCIGK